MSLEGNDRDKIIVTAANIITRDKAAEINDGDTTQETVTCDDSATQQRQHHALKQCHTTTTLPQHIIVT